MRNPCEQQVRSVRLAWDDPRPCLDASRPGLPSARHLRRSSVRRPDDVVTDSRPDPNRTCHRHQSDTSADRPATGVAGRDAHPLHASRPGELRRGDVGVPARYRVRLNADAALGKVSIVVGKSPDPGPTDVQGRGPVRTSFECRPLAAAPTKAAPV